MKSVILLESITTVQPPLLFSNVCQSGIREDNTNYIYCARRGLNEVPLFSKNNVVYDELVLSDNRITELSGDNFARIKVKKIYLNGNPLKKIDKTTFSKLENHLEELWLDADTTISANNFLIEPASNNEGIPKAILNLRNLNTLKLKGFMIKQLDNLILKKLNRIEVLSLQFCSIELIETLAFEGLKNSLKELYLDGNLLQQIPTNSLLSVGFKQLKILSLSQNNIKTINSDSFGYAMPLFDLANNPLRFLTKLDMSYNGLKLIDSEAFTIFNNSLEILSLQNNEINSFNLKFLRYLSELKELNLDFNVINKLTSNLFVNSNKMLYLTLQGNSIQFHDNDQELTSSSQEQLLLLSSKIDYESVFNGLTSLQRLNLARNGVKHLPKNLFKPLTSLKSLILDKNPIDYYDKLTFNGLELNLMNISLQNTKMKSKHLISLMNLVKLERVKLGFNDLDELDWAVFNKMHLTLTNLDLQNNQINSIYHSTCDVDYSETIVFNQPSTKECTNLMENLIELDLSNNKLCSFNSNLLDKMPKLKNLGLTQNPLYCDCNLLPLYEWTKRKFEKDMLTFIQWQCEVPDKQRRRQLTNLNEKDFQCLNNSTSKCKPFKSIISTTSTSSSTTPTTTFTTTTSTTPASLIKTESISRITNVNLKAISNSILITWELNNADKTTDDIHGFKVSYNQLYLQQSEEETTTRNNSPVIISFLTDKFQRKFKLDNLKPNFHYSVCVSLIRYNNNGYDKYCRDIELVFKSQEKIKLLIPSPSSSPPQSSKIEILQATSSSAPAITSLQTNSNLISGLMITVLSLLISFIIGLIVFSYFFIKKCRINNKNNNNNKRANNSRHAGYSGAILTTTTTHPVKQQTYCNCNNPKCELESCTSSTTSSSSTSPQSSSAICNCIRIGLNGAGCSTLARAFTIGDTSTVSSTLSSVNNNNSNNNNSNQTCKRYHKTSTIQQPNMATAQAVVMATGLPSDISSTSPTSFTHYIIQQYNKNNQQQQQVQMSYVPYEMYYQPSNQQIPYTFNTNQHILQNNWEI